MPHGNATAHSVRPPLSTTYPTAGSPPPCAFTTTSRSNVPWPWLRSRLRAPTRAMAWRIRSNSWGTPRGTGGWGRANRQASARMHHPLAQCLQVSTSPVFGPALSATPSPRGPTSRCASRVPMNSGSSSRSMATCASSLLLRWSSSSSSILYSTCDVHNAHTHIHMGNTRLPPPLWTIVCDLGQD